MTSRDKVLIVVKIFGMKDSVTGKAMNVTPGTIAKKRSLKSLDHSFNEKNYQDLVKYIKREAKKL